MRTDWSYQKLKNVCTIKPAKNEVRQLLMESDIVSFCPMEDLGIDKKYFVPNQQRSLKEVVGSYTYFRDKDVLLAKITPCFENGKLGIASGLMNGVGFGSSEYIVYRPCEKLNNEYLYYFLSQPSFREAGAKLMTGAVGHKRLPKDFYEDFEIPVPTAKEQQHIVSILDEAFAAIDQAKENVQCNLQNAKELFQSELNSIDLLKEKLGNIVNIVTGKLNANEAVEGGAYPFFTCSREIFQIDKYAFDTEAILLAGNNAVGDFNVKHYKGKFNAYQRTYVITSRNEEKIDFRYLYYQMEKSLISFKKQSVGAATKFLKLPMIQNFEIDCPSIEEQKVIVSKLDALLTETKRLEDIYQQKLNALEELKKSVLERAFRGELVGREKMVGDEVL